MNESSYQIQYDKLVKAIQEALVDYVALGDRHSATQMLDSRICYSGAPLATDFDEEDPNNALIVIIDFSGASVEKVKVGNWTFKKEEVNLGELNINSVDKVRSYFNGIDQKDHSSLRLRMLVMVSISELAEINEIIADNSSLFGSLEVTQEFQTRPDENDLNELNLTGFAKEALTHISDLANSEGERSESAKDALLLLYSLRRSVNET